jgi:hypothetical protein
MSMVPCAEWRHCSAAAEICTVVLFVLLIKCKGYQISKISSGMTSGQVYGIRVRSQVRGTETTLPNRVCEEKILPCLNSKNCVLLRTSSQNIRNMKKIGSLLRVICTEKIIRTHSVDRVQVP